MTKITTTTIIKALENQNEKDLDYLFMNIYHNQSDVDFKSLFDYLNNKKDNYSQCLLGFIYHYGLGVKQDYQIASKYYQLSADSGNAYGQNNLGHMYHSALGVEKDYQMALTYYQLAADSGNIPAQNNLGYMYHKGFGVEQNNQMAIKYYQLAADKGYIYAQMNLYVLKYNMDKKN